MRNKYFIILLLLFGLLLSSYYKRVLQPDQEIVVKAIFVDENNNKWFGTNRGLYLYNGVSWIKYGTENYIINDTVNALTFEQSSYGSELWVSTEKGVSVVSYNIDGITSATSYTTGNGVYGTKISDVVIDSRHNKFFGSEDGITFFSVGTMEEISYNDFKQSLINAPVNDLSIKNDSIYIAFDGGIGRLISDEVDGITGASRWTSEYGMTPLSGNIKCTEIDSRGNQWFGTDEGAEKHSGFKAKQDWTLYTNEDGLVHNYVQVIREANDGSIWFGTLGGVSKLKEGNWTSFTTIDGLAGDTVYDIDFEGDTVWFATHRGISRMINDQFEGIDIVNSIEITKDKASDVAIYQDKNKDLVIEFKNPQNNDVDILIYKLNGQLASSFLNNKLISNILVLKVNGVCEPGIYLIKVRSRKGFIYSGKKILLR